MYFPCKKMISYRNDFKKSLSWSGFEPSPTKSLYLPPAPYPLGYERILYWDGYLSVIYLKYIFLHCTYIHVHIYFLHWAGNSAALNAAVGKASPCRHARLGCMHLCNVIEKLFLHVFCNKGTYFLIFLLMEKEFSSS